ncbi:DUF2490 domain-containing protein [Sphingomonas melonis]|uniref:DUF2490 domain-containing protein n=1 Tax=Sphingomonas melonis TaxID=152682 RepID=UPI001C8C4A83|nr:DUF2490 domain-containing protein [Sphingomonas melonis]MBX8846548.1 DUF2490 domain-containing protein [Sphingomonas melonis]MBX8855651.1 DUF2490 domain-containing protein [Sphingomonas melonis]
MRWVLQWLIGALLLGAAQPAVAEDDTQAWAAVIASGTVRGDLFLWLEGQARAIDDVGGGSQLVLRPAIGARIGRDAHAVVGYAYVRTDPETGRTTEEHRIWQQLQFAALRTKAGAPLVISRTRLEQRMIEGRDDTGWRLRQFVRLQVPIARKGAVQAVAFTEGFFNLNSTQWGARDGVDQWRTFVGVGLPVARRMRLEPGYLNQRVFRRGEDRTNHVLSATLFVGL